MAYQIRQCNCVTLLGKLLLAQASPSQGGEDVGGVSSFLIRAARALLGQQLGPLILFPCSPDAHEAERSAKEMASLKTYVFRALRYLFSMERNRKVFKRLFPPDLFAMFIDIGHYSTALPAYSELVAHFEGEAGCLGEIRCLRTGRYGQQF